MTNKIITLRVDDSTYKKMKMHDEINWSAVLRKAIELRLKHDNLINKERAERAAKEIDKARKSGIFAGGKSGTEIIREWREKRK